MVLAFSTSADIDHFTGQSNNFEFGFLRIVDGGQTVARLKSDFDALAIRFIRGARPNASELEVGNAVARLRLQVAAGEIDQDTVLQRMRAATSTSPWAYSFGDQARACRDADAGQLSAQEKAFVAQMCALGFARTPTRKQQAWLRSIFGRLNRRAA